MQRVLSTYLYIQHRLTAAVLADIFRAGIPAVELWCRRSHFDYRSPEVVREVSEWLRDHPLRVHSLHAPTERDFAPGRESGSPISIADPERVRRLDAVDEMKRALDVAEQIPFRLMIVHIGAARESSDPRKLEAAFNSLEHLSLFAKQRGVTLALENIPGELAAPSNLRHLIEDTRLHDLRLCFDTGHAHLEDGVERSFEAMGDWMVTTHVHDNDGDKDEHLFPYEGSIDWDAALRLFAAAPVAGGLPVVLELREQPARANPLADVRRVFDRMETALNAATPATKSAGTAAGQSAAPQRAPGTR